MKTVRHIVVASPIGELTLVADGDSLTGLYFPHHWSKPDPATFGQRVDDGFEKAKRQLGEYFRGERTRFDLNVAPRGDEFQHRVWDLLGEIPYGQRTTYGDLARRFGDASLARDVGTAVGRNPLCIIVPCHRVVGADGKLTGYAGGLQRKRFLLDLEEPAEKKAPKLL